MVTVRIVVHPSAVDGADYQHPPDTFFFAGFRIITGRGVLDSSTTGAIAAPPPSAAPAAFRKS